MLVNNKYEKEEYDNYKNYVNGLENEYRRTFEKIEVYINNSTKLNIVAKNNCLLQILDTFLSAQEEGKEVGVITGKDLRKYCDNMIHGEAIYVYKASRICFNLLVALFYISYISFFINVYDAMNLEDISFIFKQMKFGIAEIILASWYMCIPKFISLVTRNYFENPKRYRKVKIYTYCVVWGLTILVYPMININFKKYGIDIPFANVVLILIYSTLVSLVVWLFKVVFSIEKRYNSNELLNKQYEKHKVRCEKRNKNPLEWNNYLKKKYKDNRLFIIIFSLYLIIFLILAFLIARGMLVDGNIEVIGIIILIMISLLFVVITSAIRLWIIENRVMKF